MTRGFGLWALGFVTCALCLVPLTAALAQINMPDPSIIHGKALPAPELAVGTVTVPVVGEAIGNTVTGQDVRVTAGGTTRTARTDEQGRAEFTGLTAGAEARAETTVNGEQLVSDPFTVPAQGGLRVILVAGLKEAAARREKEAAAAGAAAPASGTRRLRPRFRFAAAWSSARTPASSWNSATIRCRSFMCSISSTTHARA